MLCLTEGLFILHTKDLKRQDKTTAVLYTNHADAQYMARAVHDEAELITLGKCNGGQAERCQEIVTERNIEQFTLCAKMLRKQKCQQRILMW